MKAKASKQKNKPSPKKISKLKHETLNTIISIVAIIVSATLSVIAINNDTENAKLNENPTPNPTPAPKLEYYFEISMGKIRLRVINKGEITASNVRLTINYQEEYDIADCISYAPFQDFSQTQPQYNDISRIISNTFQIPSIPIGGAFSLSCQIYYTNASVGVGDTPEEILENLLEDYKACPTTTKIHIEDVKSWEITSTSDRVVSSIEIISDNSKPAKKINPPSVNEYYPKDTSTVFVWKPKDVIEGYSLYEIGPCATDANTK